MTEPGFWKIATGFRASLKKSGEEETDTNKEELLEENLQEGMEFSRIQAEADRHFTSPPKAFTEDTLLMAMETAGTKSLMQKQRKKGLAHLPQELLLSKSWCLPVMPSAKENRYFQQWMEKH